MAVPAGMRFGCGGIFYKRGEQESAGCYRLVCEQPGTEGNLESGELLPVDYLENFGSAKITGLIAAGEDEETDGARRERLLAGLGLPRRLSAGRLLAVLNSLMDRAAFRELTEKHGGGGGKPE